MFTQFINHITFASFPKVSLKTLLKLSRAKHRVSLRSARTQSHIHFFNAHRIAVSFAIHQSNTAQSNITAADIDLHASDYRLFAQLNTIYV